MYTDEQVDYTHDVLTDLVISCMRSGHIPYEKPNIDDWCIEISSFRPDHDHCIGQLVKYINDGYQIQTIGGKIVNWRNAELAKIPSKHLRGMTDIVWQIKNP